MTPPEDDSPYQVYTIDGDLVVRPRQPLVPICTACHCTIVDAAGDLCPACKVRRNLSRGQQSLEQSRLGAFGCPSTTSDEEDYEKWCDLNERAEFEIAQFAPYSHGPEVF